MAVLPTGIGPVTGGYQIERSLRFNSADTAYLNRTPAGAGNRQTWTWSGWIKRSGLAAVNSMFFAQRTSGTDGSGFFFTSSDTIRFYSYNGASYDFDYITTQVFRDVGAWYHLVFVLDTTNATSTDRVRIYVNGTRITAWGTSTAPSLNYSGYINQASIHRIGSDTTLTYYSNQYLTEINFIDGQALTPSSFGETDSNTGVWKPKAYTGTYGTNGFYLKFADNSGTTSTTLGKDSSGNGNNWTPNNFSVTAGSGNDSLVDTPTSYGTDTGVGGEVRGNYSTFNALQIGSSTTLNNGNLDSAATASSFNTVIGTMFVSSGKWYAEVTVLDVSADYSTKRVGVGIIKDTGTEQGSYLGSSANGYGYFANATRFNNATSASYGATYVTNDVIGIAMDLDAGTVVFYKNNVSQGTAYSSLSGSFTFAASHFGSGAKVAINFGQRAFAYTAPSGFKALCTQNLPTPTIGATSTTQANDYFNTVLYTGTGSSNAQTGVGFQPDLVWIKGRSGATDHGLYDAVRGVQKQLESNTTTAETTETTGLTAFGTNGFTVGALAQLNTSSATYVAWNWKANGAGSSNTAGTITSTVSANTTSGFSIVTFTGTGANATVGHGLGVAPSMYIVKNRPFGGSWGVYHTSIGATNRLLLNGTNASTADSGFWNNTAPTSTVFSVGNDGAINRSGDSHVAYCFAPVAGYSAFGSYTGNGSTDGPFVYTGFRPRYLLIKKTSAAQDWYVYDTARDSYNEATKTLFPNGSFAEESTRPMDFLSNGFKLRVASNTNDSGATYIYMAFAENPFKYSLAR